MAIFDAMPMPEDQHDQRGERELGQRFETDDVGLHNRCIIPRPPERQAESGPREGSEEKAEDGRTKREGDIRDGIAGGEEDRERVVDRARLRPEERVDEAVVGADLPQRHDADQDGDLHRHNDEGRPVALYR
jgi:hypothetical protein